MPLSSSIKILFILSLFLSACHTLPKHSDRQDTKQSPSQIVTESLRLQHKKEWTNAIEILKNGLKNYPDNPLITKAIKALKTSKRHEKNMLDHRLLIVQVNALVQEKKILEQINKIRPNNLIVSSDLLINKYLSLGKITALENCIKYQKNFDLKLANECSKLITLIDNKPEYDKKYQQINQLYQKTLNKKKHQNNQIALDQKLKETKEFIEKEDYSSAHQILKKIITLYPNNQQAKQLINDLDKTIHAQEEVLLQMGDQFYREGNLKQSIIVWESFLKLAPDNAAIKLKIERAKYILKKLKKLRTEQIKN